MLGAGDLDRRIIIERSVETGRNGLNEPTTRWATYVEVWAQRKDASDGERLAAGEVGASLMSRFVVRWSSRTATVTSGDRISHDGGIWNIKGIKETPDGRRRFREITAVRKI